jgi:predicted transcriptional regulator of viral defense system
VLVARRAAEQQGQITIAELRDCGLGSRAVAVRVRNGQLHRMYRGVYAVGHAGVTREGRCMAAVLACGDRAYLSWYAAGMLLEYLPREERLPDVTVVGSKARRVHGINVHRARSLHWRDVTHHRGIPVTSPERTLLDLATVLSPQSLRTAARRAQAAHQVIVPGAAAVHRALERAPRDRRAARGDRRRPRAYA